MLMQLRTAVFAGALVLPAGLMQAQNTGMDQSDSQQLQRSTQQALGQRGSSSADRQTQQQLIQMLRMGNQAEIELAQLAQQQAQSEEVKQFAQKMQRDHQQFLQQLERAAPGSQAMSQRSGTGGESQQRATASGGSQQQASSSGGMTGATGSQEGSASATGGATAMENRERGASAGPNARIGERESTTGSGNELAEASRAGQTGEMATESAQREVRQRVGQSTGEMAADTDAAASQVYGYAAGGEGSLTQIMQEVHQKHMQSTKQMLSEKQGTEFDKAYMGNQIMMHQGMLDKLQVFGKHVDQDAQQVLQQGEQTVRQHLEQAKQIMKQLDQQG